MKWFSANTRSAIELDGQVFSLNRDRLSPHTDIQRLRGDHWLISDLQGAIARTMTVEADARYVELMVSRKLQEDGEFDEPVSVISHWKKRRGKNTTDICFTALPSRRYYQYLDVLKTHHDNLLLVPLMAMLVAVARKARSAAPVAVVFQHGRSAELLIGSRQRIYYAQRLITFDTSEEQISALWENVRQEVATVAADYQIDMAKVIRIGWIDDGPMPSWPDDCPFSIEDVQPATVFLDGEARRTAVFEIARGLSLSAAVNPPLQKIGYMARRARPYAYAAGLAATVFFLAGVQVIRYQQRGLEVRLTDLHGQVDDVLARVPELPDVPDYMPAVNFVQRMAEYRQLPTVGRVLADFSKGQGPQTVLEDIRLAYAEGQLTVEAFGRSDAPFDRAYRDYQHLLAVLRKRGYRIEDHRLDTRISQSRFTIKAVRKAT